MPQPPAMTAEISPFVLGDAGFGDTEFDESEFDLDLRVVEATYPIATLMCDTSDNCGSTCSGSACNSSANEPF